jgi:hypothetical protein
MPLSDSAIREAKPRDKAYKLSDSEGLYLEVSTSGAKLWRWKFRFHGKEKKLAIGIYPAITLKQAREKRNAAKADLALGKDPSREKQRKAMRTPAIKGAIHRTVAPD